MQLASCPAARDKRAVVQGAACLIVASSLLGCSGSSPDIADYEGTPARVRRMTLEQYANTIHYVFGNDIDVGKPFAPLRRTEGLLASGAARAGVTSGELQQLQRSASAIAAQVMDKGNIERKTPSRRDFLVPCKPQDETAADDACARKFIRHVGRLLYRRPLADTKVAELVERAQAGATDLEDFYAALATVLEGMLIDPKFLLLVDTTEPDPDDAGKRRLDAYSLAARLSFFLWNATPDDALLQAAESGELQTKKGLAREVDRMLASPRLETGMRAFFDDMFGFEGFGNLAKDASVYPMVTGATLQDAREQTLRTVIDRLITRKSDYRELFTTRETFMSPALATIYQVPTLPGWVPYEFPADSPRVGLLTHISFLSLHAHPARSSPTYRGKALRERLLCQSVPPPPGNVDFSAIENPDAALHTARDRLEAHRTNPSCAGCHKITDPIGLTLENFDGAGRYRDEEQGKKIDISGGLDGMDFNTVAGLGQALHDHPALPTCLVQRIYSYGTGGPLTPADRPAVKALTDGFRQVGYRLPDLLRVIVLNDAFRQVVEDASRSHAKQRPSTVTASLSP
jgi:Protein of unknown function (DUF1592)/Protein of unknown function (DUF1588)/Protein of unknown function (DUF1585)/Protein of unknown function (DUF1595)/Protein of unknown function (DUF1587)